MAKLTDNQKLGIVAGVTLALCGAGGGGVWWAKGLVQEKADQIAQMRTEIDDANAKIEKIPGVESQLIILRENLSHYVKILPEETELSNFVRAANQFISQSGVSVSRFEPGRPSGGGKRAFEKYSYKFEIEATLWQFMQFMNFFESYERFVQVKEFSLTSQADREPAGATDVKHKIGMTVETYVYTGAGKGKDVKIPNYRNKVERLREQIFEARQEIVTVGYKFQGDRGRRDIFVDPRQDASSGTTGPGGLSPQEQKKIIDITKAQIADIRKIGERLQDKSITVFQRYKLLGELGERLDAVETRIDEVNSKNLVSHAPLKLVWTREAVEQVQDLRRLESQLKGVKNRDSWLAEEEMKILINSMTDNLAGGELDTAVQAYDNVASKLGVPKDDPRYPLRLRIEDLHMRAKIAQEFSAKKLDISGICVNAGGKSGLILNGVVYEVGEHVDADLLVKKVTRERVEFVYRGFTIVRTL